MLAFEAPALAAIRSAFGEPVLYDGAGMIGTVTAIYSNGAAPAFQGAGNTAREVSFEIARDQLPERPRKDNTITREGVTWRVIDATERDDVDAWVLVVERA